MLAGAAEQGLDLLAHYAHLLVHGTLHAQGFDHERDEDAVVMEARETEVLRLVAKGMANKQIASELAIGEPTVKSHVAHILEKLGAPDRTRAVTLAMERGLLR